MTILAPIIAAGKRLIARPKTPPPAAAGTTGPLDPDDDPDSLVERIQALERADHRLIAAESRLRDVEDELVALRAQVSALVAGEGRA
jgi:hypothetical protein